MTLLTKRDFLKLLVLPFVQACISCVYNKGERPAPKAKVWQQPSAFLHDFNGATVVGEDEILISWTDTDVFPLDLVFSPDNGATLEKLITLNDNTPYLWTVPQLNSTQAFLKLVTPKGETKTGLFNIVSSLVLLLDHYPGLENPGTYTVINTVRYRELVLRNTGNGYTAISLTCTHNGCTAQPDHTEIYCSCHGSRFTLAGEVINGPAALPLQTIRTKEVVGKKKILLFE